MIGMQLILAGYFNISLTLNNDERILAMIVTTATIMKFVKVSDDKFHVRL